MTSRTSGNGHGDSVSRFQVFKQSGFQESALNLGAPTPDRTPLQLNPLSHGAEWRNFAIMQGPAERTHQFCRIDRISENTRGSSSENTRGTATAYPFTPKSPDAHLVRARIFGKCALQLGPDSPTDPFVNAGAHRKSAHFLKRTIAS